MSTIHPLLQILLAHLLLIWPVIRLYQRAGLSPWWALLLMASVLVPLLGVMLVAAHLALNKWPKFPDPPKPPKPVKVAI
jgi:hypothetical protein